MTSKIVLCVIGTTDTGYPLYWNGNFIENPLVGLDEEMPAFFEEAKISREELNVAEPMTTQSLAHARTFDTPQQARFYKEMFGMNEFTVLIECEL